MKSSVIKRSISIDGHKTSVSLEDAFWSCLTEIAQAQGATVSQTVTKSTGCAEGPTGPPRSASLYSTGSAHKKWGPPRGNGSPENEPPALGDRDGG